MSRAGRRRDCRGCFRGLPGSLPAFVSVMRNRRDGSMTAGRSAEDRIFTRLRIWALRILEVIPHAAFEDALAGLSDDAFWDVGHQPDLLRALGARWSELDKDARIRIGRENTGRPSAVRIDGRM